MSIPTYQARKFGPAASTVTLCAKGGGILKGIWISAKGSSPTFAIYDDTASVAGSAIVPSFIPAAVGMNDFGGIGLGKGLTVHCVSCTGTVIYAPSQAL